MKHWQLTPYDQPSGLELRERPALSPGVGQVKLKMLAASLNYRDLLVLERTYTSPQEYRAITPLSDGVGIVSELGLGVDRVVLGDRVAANFMPGWIDGAISPEKIASALGGGCKEGVLAEEVILPASALVKVPEHLSDEEAATLPCAGVTAWYALFEGNRILPGDTVLIIGTGGVSLFALQFARAAGARVIATTRSAEKMSRLQELGAAEVLQTQEQENWAERVIEFTDGRGVDLAVDVSGPATFNQTLQAVRTGGAISLMGVLSGLEGPVSTGLILLKQIRVQGTYVGSRTMFEQMNRAISINKMKPIVDRVFAFEEVPQAMSYLKSGRHFGKVCFRISNN